MKKIVLITMLLASVVAAQQIVSGSILADYTENGNTMGSPVGQPVSRTAGIALLSNDKPPKPVKYINLTLQGIWDGGQGFHFTGAAARAWKYSPQRTCNFDGGSSCIQNWDGGYAFAWSRYPALDFAYATDSGTPYVQHGPGGLSFSAGLGAPYGNTSSAPTYNGSRLYYTVESLTTADAGTMGNVRVILEGVY